MVPHERVNEDRTMAKKTESWTATEERAAKNGAHLEAMATTPAKGLAIALPKLDIRTIKVRIVGDAPLIVHRWSEKAKKQILDKQMGVASAGTEPKNPENDYRESLYVIEPAKPGEPFESGRFGFPTIAFKNCAVTACTSLGKSVTKVAARQAFHVIGELTEILGVPSMREDMVKVGVGTADIRYRGEFTEWECDLLIRYNARVLTAEQITNLLNTSGFAVGVGEWRSEKDGSFGLFHVG
jgi:hypothetical protein